MVDRQKVETVLTRRFPGACHQQVATAANAIMGLGEEWEEIVGRERPLACHTAEACSDVCYLARALDPDCEFRLFRRREA